MKIFRPILWMLLLSVNLSFAQTVVYDTISLGGDYINQSYYSLENGESANLPATDWDLGFNTHFMSASIRVNSGNGVQLYNLQNPDTAQWSVIDTAGMMPIYDSDTSWEIGSFNANATGHPNYGWGSYENLGFLKGLKVFVIKLADGSLKKIWIKSLDGLLYTIHVGNIDNTGEYSFTLDKGDFTTKSFVYYSLSAQQVVDAEPVKEDWDLVFRRFMVEVAPGLFYQVTGVLNNIGITSSEARGIPADQADQNSAPFVTNISNIGHDWKAFNMTTFMWELEDSLSYFVNDLTGNIYHLSFTGFEGAGTGNIMFSKTLLSPATSIENIGNSSLNNIAIYPNPMQDQFNLLINAVEHGDISLTMIDINGKEILKRSVHVATGLNNFNFNPQLDATGTYLIQITSGEDQIYQQVIKH